jgi:hypothetical protein
MPTPLTPGTPSRCARSWYICCSFLGVMKKKLKYWVVLVIVIAFMPSELWAQDTEQQNPDVYGIKLRAGGRYDDVRMCVASPAGAKGGPALEISLFGEFGVSENTAIAVNVPIMRPILFGAAFEMLQFEPEVALLFRIEREGSVDVILGPSLGITLHYGPDYKSESSGDERRDSFFAMGPRIGGYIGLDFKRPGKTFNFQLGLSPYVVPLFSIDDSENHNGVVVGGILDGQFRFSV